ncbi:MAG: porin [Alphaproteobacteria bacterium]|nr:porin [Alphaproteobacteria bacterium]
MKRKLTFTAALATTASVALLAGAAHAQMGPAPTPCTTTQIFPGHNNCVMPSAQAPGGGSFPGSFLVPGTNTSFAVHGFIQVDVIHDMGPHFGDTSFSADGVPLQGLGITTATQRTYGLNGGTTMGVKPTRPNIETRTPTAYGELKTYIEFDFNQTAGTQLAGNNDVLRLRQAYGTLGPWLIGQTLSLYADPGAYADTAAGAQDVGMMDTFNVRRPQVRYTWLAGNGLSVAGSVEEPSFPLGVSASVGSDTAAALTTVSLNGTSVYYNWPRFVAAAEWDQPWGHLKFAAAGGVDDTREANVLAGGSTSTPNRQIGDGAFSLSGHLNTWGKDALRGGVEYNYGAADFDSWITQGSWVEDTSTGVVRLQKAWSIYANYEHFFTGQWRANASLGWMTVSGNPFSVACGAGTACPQAGMVKRAMTSELNVIYSPVPQTDFILEWARAYRKMQSGADGTGDQLDAQFKFYF